MHRDDREPRKLPEWLQREVDDLAREEAAERRWIAAGVLIVATSIIGAAYALVTLPA